VRLTHGPSEDQLPLWSRSGRIFFSSLQNGNFDVYSQAPDGATAARVEFEAPGDQMPLGFTPDGTQLIVNENYRDVSVLTLTPPHRLEPLLHSSAGEWCADVSPDGKWVAYESDESGDQVEIFVRPFPAVDAGRQKVSLDGGRYPLWSPDGKELYYVTASGAMMAVSVRLSPTLALGGVTKLFDTRPPTHGISSRPYDVSPVDGRFLVTKPVVSGAAPGGEVTVVLNWLEDLKRRVPTR
jgi:Tol biopolymer transport system component